MPLYQVSGKWYHGGYSHGVREVMEAALPASALRLFIESILGFTEDDEPDWDYKPSRVKYGRQEPQPRFWVGGDQMYVVWDIFRVRPIEVQCHTCNGAGTLTDYEHLDRRLHIL